MSRYQTQTWINGTPGNTPVDAARLSYMESGIAAAYDAGVLNVLDTGADPTGVNDSSGAFTAALGAGQTVIIPPGNFTTSTYVEVPSGSHLIVDGTITCTAISGPFVVAAPCPVFVVVGNNVLIEGSGQLLGQIPTVVGGIQIGVPSGLSIGSATPTNVRVSGNLSFGAGTGINTGIAIAPGCSDITIDGIVDNTITTGGTGTFYGIYAAGTSGQPITNLTLGINNVFADAASAGLTRYGAYLQYINDLVVVGNSLEGDIGLFVDTTVNSALFSANILYGYANSLGGASPSGGIGPNAHVFVGNTLGSGNNFYTGSNYIWVGNYPGGTDYLVASNNLSDVASAATSRSNLGAAPLASPTFTGITTAPEFTASGLAGATAASRYVGATTSGAPVSGTFAKGDFIVDQTGNMWICTTAGSPGTWTEVAGGGGGGVSSFNTRAGAITLTSTDVLTTALSTPGGTTDFLRADGTWAVPSGSGSGNFTVPYFLAVETYGVKADGKMVFDGAMSSSVNPTHLTNATSTPYVSGDVGKSVRVLGAGVAGAALCTTIASFTSSSLVVLTTGASTTVSGAEVDYGTDDTTAWRAAMTALAASPAGGIIYCSEPGISMLAGAPVAHPLGSTDGLLNLPYIVSGSAEYPFTPVGIVGPVPPAMPYTDATWQGSDNVGQSLILMAIGSAAQAITSGGPAGSVINGGSAASATFSGINVILENVLIRVPQSSGYNAVYIPNVQQCLLRNVGADVPCTDMPTTIQPKGSNCGFYLPQNANGAQVVIESAFSMGYTNGFNIGEHCEADHLVAGFCTNGYMGFQADHSIHLGRVGSFWNTNHLVGSGLVFGGSGPSSCPLSIDQLDIEDAPTSGSPWYATSYHINDPSNYLVGQARIHIIQGGSHSYAVPVQQNGGIYVALTSLAHLTSYQWWKPSTGSMSWSYANGWADDTGNSTATKFRLTSAGQVELQIGSNGSSATSETIFTLPAGMRPGQYLYFPMWNHDGSNVGCGIISTAGVVQIQNNAGSSWPSSPVEALVSFSAEN